MSQVFSVNNNEVKKHYYNEIKPATEPVKVVSTLYVKPTEEPKLEIPFGDSENIITKEELQELSNVDSEKEIVVDEIKEIPKKKIGRSKKINGSHT